MKRFVALFLVLMLSVCLFSACNTEKEPDPQPEVKYGRIFYVAVDGNDANEGTKESPFATIGGAAAKVREYKKANGLPEGGIKVEFAAVTYKVTQQTDLTEEDAGEEGKPIVYAAADGAEVIFDGGLSLNPADFKPANDEFKALLQTEEAKENVLEIDLAAAGIWDADDSKAYYVSWDAYDYRQSLYVNNKLQTVARWPNEDYYTPGKIAANAFTDENGSVYGLIPVPQEQADAWKGCKNIRFYGYPVYDWSSTFVWDMQVNAENSVLLYPMNYDYGLENSCHFMLFNIPAELDMPGEYYWDVTANKLYYWPEKGFETSKINFSQCKESVISLTHADYVTFEGFTFENLRYNAIASVNGKDSDYVTVSNCIFRCTASYPVNLWGTNILVTDNEFCDLGGGAISVNGGDIATQVLSKSVITNNKIHDWSQVYTVYNAGIKTVGMGFLISHNELFNSPHEAITFGSGNTVVEYNEIHNVCTETMDAGAIYSGRRWDWGNTVIRYNYVHDISTISDGIYLDDMLSKQVCYGNILVNIGGRAFSLNGGRFLDIYNNIMVNTGNFFLSGVGFEWYPTWNSYPDGGMWQLGFKENYLTDLWRYMQPEYLSMLEMRTTEEKRSLKGLAKDVIDSPSPPAYENFYNNILYINEYTVPNKGIDMINDAAYPFSYIEDYIEYTEYPEDVFADPANGNFFLKDDSRVYRDIIGFEKWDYSLIGPQK